MQPRQMTGDTPPIGACYYGSLHLVDLSAYRRLRRSTPRRCGRFAADVVRFLRSYGKAVNLQPHDDKCLLGIDLIIEDGQGGEPADSPPDAAATPTWLAEFATRYERVVVVSADDRLVSLVQALRGADVRVVVAVPSRWRSGPLASLATEIVRFRVRRRKIAGKRSVGTAVRLGSARSPPLLLHTADEVGGVRSERDGELGDGVEARVPGSTFERSDIGPVDPGAEREVLLRHQ